VVQIGHLWIDHYEACRTASECLIRPGSPALALIQSDLKLKVNLYYLSGSNTLEPLQADLGVGVSSFGARLMPSRGGVRGPVGSMG